MNYTDEDAIAAAHVILEMEGYPRPDAKARVHELLTKTSLARLSQIELKCILLGARNAMTDDLWGGSSSDDISGVGISNLVAK